MAGGTLDDCFHALDVGLPGSVGTSVGVRNLNAKRNTLAANIALCQLLHLQSLKTFWSASHEAAIYNSISFPELQEKILEKSDFFWRAAGIGTGTIRARLRWTKHRAAVRLFDKKLSKIAEKILTIDNL